MWRGELPADDLAAVGVDHEGEEQDALPAAQVGEVGDPEPIRAGGAEVALDQVGPAVRRGIGRRRPPGLARAAWRLGSRAARISRCTRRAADLLAGARSAIHIRR